jgi:hypothetical protein
VAYFSIPHNRVTQLMDLLNHATPEEVLEKGFDAVAMKIVRAY